MSCMRVPGVDIMEDIVCWLYKTPNDFIISYSLRRRPLEKAACWEVEEGRRS